MISPWVFAAAFEKSPNAMMIVDRDLRYVAANDAYCAATATPREALIGNTLFDLFPNDPQNPNNANAVLLRESIERVFQSGRPDALASISYRVPEQTLDGVEIRERIWSATHTPLINDYGRVAYVMQNTVDVTELGNAESTTVLSHARTVTNANNLLRLERAQLRQLFEQAPGFVGVLRGPKHVLELANAAYLALVDRTAEIIGRPLAEAIPEIVAQGFLEKLDHTYAEGTPFVANDTAVMFQRNGEMEERHLDFIYQPILENGRTVGIFVMGTDVSGARSLMQERSVAHARAVAAANETRFMSDVVPVQMWTANAEGRATSINRATIEYFGPLAPALLEGAWQRIVHPDDLPQLAERWGHALTTGEPAEVEVRLLRHRDSTWRWHLIQASLKPGEDGSEAKWFGSNVDIDHLKATQQQHEKLIAQLESKNRELDRFAYVASHDLKAPLRGIANISQWILEDLGEAITPQVQDNLKHLESRVVRMQQLIDGVLIYSRSLEGQRDVRVIDPATFFPELITLASPPDGTSIVVEQPFPSFSAPPLPLTQVLLNLISNAIKHAPGGTITIAGRLIARQVEISVSDDGPGIAPEHHQRIWELFQTLDSDPKNTGIGLSIVRRIVESLGGRVAVKSAEGEGATFSFTLPQ